jgi:hypothetical protein
MNDRGNKIFAFGKLSFSKTSIDFNGMDGGGERSIILSAKAQANGLYLGTTSFPVGWNEIVCKMN